MKKSREDAISIIIGKVTIVLYIILFVWLTVSTILAYMNQSELRNYGLETSATVVEIVERSNRRMGRIYVEYTVDGIAHQNELHLLAGRAYLGKEVLIYFNEHSPNRITLVDRTLASDSLGRLMAYPILLLSIFLLFVMWFFVGMRIHNIQKCRYFI